MATFKAQIEGLTGLSIGTSPTQDEVSQFLVDGTKEVVNRIITLNPYETSKFCTTTNSTSSITKTGKLLSVMREHDSTSILRKCDQIDPHDRYSATDTESLNYRSKYNPGFYELNGDFHTVPAADTGNNDISVTQVVYAVNTGWSSSSIDNFPDEYEYLVAMYAAIKSLQNALSAIDDDLPADLNNIVVENISLSLPTFTGPSSFVMPPAPAGVDIDFSEVGSIASFITPTFSIPTLGTISSMSLPSVPSVPTVVGGSLADTSTPPEYSEPVVSMTTTPSIADLSITAAVPIAPILSDSTVSEESMTAPVYTPPIMGALDYSDADTWINTEEDSEMLEARIEEITARITEYQAKVENSIAAFNKDNSIFQKDLEVALTNANLNSQDDVQKLQKYNTEIQSYTQDVQKQVQLYQSNVQKETNLWQAENQLALQQYQADIQNALNSFNKESAIYQSKLQRDITTAQLHEGKEDRNLQKYAAEVNAYSQQVNTEVQRWTGEVFNKEFNEWSQKYQGELQEYASDIQKENARVSSSLSEYQVVVNKAIQEYQAESGYDLSKYQAEIQANIAKFQNDLTENSTDFANNLEKYMSEVQKVFYSNKSNTDNFANKVQDYSVKLQKNQLKYGWMEGRMMKLQQDYNTSFQLMMPAQQQQQGGNDGR